TDSESGEALPGVNVIIQGTTQGTVTDLNGNFTLQASPEDVLIFSFIGYLTEEVTVGNGTAINMSLVPNIETLSEVVVVDYGYGTVKKADLTGSVASLSAKDLKKVPVANAAEAITGRLPGVRVM